jgi:hypothetical protein
MPAAPHEGGDQAGGDQIPEVWMRADAETELFLITSSHNILQK